MRRPNSVPAAFGILFCACLRAPPAPAPADAGVDAGPARFVVQDVYAEDRMGRRWPDEAIPRAPQVVIELSEPPTEGDEEWAWLLGGEADETLIEDAARPPLRAAHRERQLPATLRVSGSTVILTPLDRLTPDQSITALLGGWARSDLAPLEAPFARTFVASSAADAGTRPLGSWPADGASGVPPGIAELWLGFDGPVTLDGVRLREGSTMIPASVREAPCSQLGWEGSCVILRPELPLAPGAEHTLDVGVDALDPTGAPVGPWQARFRTAIGADAAAPALVPPACALDELTLEVGCALVDEGSLTLRVSTDEPSRLALTLGGRRVVALAPRGEASLRVHGLPPGARLEGSLTATDLAGNTLEGRIVIETPSDLAPLSLTEVRANPAGPEPHQEYVEVLNSGDVPLDLLGFAISDRPDTLGDVVDRTFVLGAGERVLLVADRFDPDDPDDSPAVPPGIPLLRIGSSIASGGLTNAGEPLFLRDALGRRLSATPATELGSGQCLARRAGAPPRVADPEAFEVRPCRPGRP